MTHSVTRFAVCLVVMFAALSNSTTAQTVPEARREKLLNNLTVLHVPQGDGANVLMKLRVRGGAAFDLTNKEGTAQLLADTLFPDAETFDFVREELGGTLDVAVDYDGLTITLSGRASEIERMVELLRNALITNPTVEPATFRRLRDARIKAVNDSATTSQFAAGNLCILAAQQQLYGEAFPLGRTPVGSPASLARIEPADLILARERFLNPNTAVLAVVGNVEPARLRRALRQYLGSWRMSDKVVPATFTRPDFKPAATLILDRPQGYEVCVAVRGIAHRDRDLYAAHTLDFIAQNRWRASLGIDRNAVTQIPNYTVKHFSYDIGGTFTFKANSSTHTEAALAVAKGVATIKALATGITASEFETAKQSYLAYLQSQARTPLFIADALIDKETYERNRNDTEGIIRNLTLADVQRVARNLFTDANIARVFIGDAAMLKTELARTGETGVQVATFNPEIAVQKVKAAPKQATVKPATTTPANRRTFTLPPSSSRP